MSEEDLPEGWRRVPVREACGLINGRAFKPTDWTSHGVPIVRIQNLNDATKQFNRYAGEVEPKHMIDSGELLFAWSGTPGTSFGAHIWNGGPAVLNQHIFRVIPNEKLVGKEFLRHAINDRLDHLIGIAHGGAGLAHVTKPVFEATELSLPVDLDEQRRIVAKLDALRARSRRAKDALDAVPALLDRLRQSILAAAFRGDLTADWREQNPDVEPASELLKRIRIERRKRWEEAELAKLTAKGKRLKDDAWKAKYVEPEPVDESDLPELPEGWCWASLREIADLKGGITKGQKRATGTALREVPYLRVANVQRGYLKLDDISMIDATPDEVADLTLQLGDLLFNEGGDRDKLGRGWIWEGQIPECIHQNHVFRGRLVSKVIVPALMSHYANSMGQAYFLREGAQTTNLASINITKLGALPVPILPCEEQAALLANLATALSAATRLAEGAFAGLAAISELERAVLAAAFRGELLDRQSAAYPGVSERS